jgi:hypothetical protein
MKTALGLLVLFLAGIAVYAYMDPTFRQRLDSAVVEKLSPAPPVTRAYTWRDASGTWQITDQPPPAGVPHDTVEVHPDQNVLPLPPQLRQE